MTHLSLTMKMKMEAVEGSDRRDLGPGQRDGDRARVGMGRGRKVWVLMWMPR